MTEAWKNMGRYYGKQNVLFLCVFSVLSYFIFVFTGNGNSFLISLYPKMEVYEWTKKNNFFMLANDESIAMGGGNS